MLKKGLPIIFMSALLLGACSMASDRALPNNNETPMEELDNREERWSPDVRDEQRGGADLDGIETEERRNNDGIMNDNRGNDGLMNEDNRVPRHEGKGENTLE